MRTTTIRLEKSAYELLKARKLPDESFSEEVIRLLGESTPNLRGFLDIVPEEDGVEVADAIAALRAEDLGLASKSKRVRKHGRRP